MENKNLFLRPIEPNHPIWDFPKADDAKRFLSKVGVEGWNKFIKSRNDRIRASKIDPLRFGYKPDIWNVVRREFQNSDLVICLGGNRSSKTELGADLVARTVSFKRWWKDYQNKDELLQPVNIACFSQVERVSQILQQPRVYKYLPPELRDLGKSRKADITFTVGKGFKDNIFVTPDGSICEFKNYSQDLKSFQGLEYHFIWLDEMLGGTWLSEAMLRTMSCQGKVLVTVTLIDGMIHSIKEVLDECEIIEQKPVNQDFFKENIANAALARNCKPGCVPVIARNPDSRKSVVWLHTEENKFNPLDFLRRNLFGKPREYVLIRAYGYCESVSQRAFPKFKESVHVLKFDDLLQLAKTQKYTLYQSCDVGGSKPWLIKWYAVFENEVAVLIREFPDMDTYGPWAEAPEIDSKRPCWKRGVAHNAFLGAGVVPIKKLFKFNETEILPRLLGAEKLEKVYLRFIDPRGAAVRSERAENTENWISLMFEKNYDYDGKTLTGDSYIFTPAFSGSSGDGKAPIESSISLINNRLDYNQDEKISVANHPTFYILESCKQSILAYKNFTLQNDRNCPLKDIIDPDRYFFNMAPRYVDMEIFKKSDFSGGSY